MRRTMACLVGLVGLAAPLPSAAAVHNALVLNEANSVTGSKFLDDQNRNRTDLTLGRLQGNGQNWLEFLVVQGDEQPAGGFKNTLDLREWSIDWSYDKNDATDPDKRGNGTIKFTDDALWSAVPVGTLITITEWQQAWYHDAGTDPAQFGGLQRDGGVDGLGMLKGDPYIAGFHSLRDFHSDAHWNPRLNGGGASADWRIQIWAGERNPDQSFKYFTFDGQIIDGDPVNPIAIGSENGGLFVVNNDNWQWTIFDADGGDPIQGPFGEALSSGSWSVNSQEIFRLEDFPVAVQPTQATYLGVEIGNYQDGSSGAFGKPNAWSGGSVNQDLSPLRNWLEEGDVDLDGQVAGGDFIAWQRGYGLTAASSGPDAKVSFTEGDVNGDSKVDGLDLNLWKQEFGAHAATIAVATPESSTALLASLGAVLVSIGCRRRPTQGSLSTA